MVAFLIRRCLATIPVMAVVAVFVFSLLYFAPGDPVALIAGDQASQAQIDAIRERLGLDQPYFVRLLTWLGQIVRLDLGQSIISGLPVTTLIAERLAPTISLMVIAIPLSVLMAVPMGIVAAWRAGTWIDRAVMVVAILGFSVPVFVVAYGLSWGIGLKLGWLPVQGYQPLSNGLWPWLSHLILPSVTVGSVYIALIARTTRAAMLDVLKQDYIRTAQAKGLGLNAVLFVHALKNAGIPIMTVVGIGVALLLGGAVVVESIFSLPGLGRLTIDAILKRDYPVIQGVVLLFSFAYVFVNLLVDLAYTLIDPRIRY
jgi:peptide/nickel transport system permease protein